MKPKHLYIGIIIAFAILVLVYSQCGRKATPVPSPSPSVTPTPSPSVEVTIQPLKERIEAVEKVQKRIASAQKSAPEVSAFPVLVAGDKVAIPQGIFAIPLGMTAQVFSTPGGSQLCGSTISPPCKMQWTGSRGEIIRVELSQVPGMTRAKVQSVIRTPVDYYNAERLRRGLTSRVYFGGEIPSGETAIVPPGKFIIIHHNGTRYQSVCMKQGGLCEECLPVAMNRTILDPSCEEYRSRYQ